MTISKTYLGIIAGIILVAFLVSFKECSIRQASADHFAALYDYEHQVTDSFRNAANQHVVEQTPVVTPDQETIKQLSTEIFNLGKKLERKIREVQALVQAQQIVRITDTLIGYEPEAGQVDTGLYILPPRKFQATTPHYTIAGVIQRNGVQIDSILVPNTISFRIADKKVNFWGKRELTVQALNSNPLVTTPEIHAMVYQPKKSFFQKTIPRTAVTIALWEGLKYTLKSINK